MPVSSQQQLDLLWKKLGHGVVKTDTTEFKDATNESISSAPFIPADRIWSQSFLIPGVIPTVTDSIVAIYKDSLFTTIQCEMDITASENRTWSTGLKDWIPIQFGSTYLVKVYLDNISSTTPESTGTQLFPTGAEIDDEWYFDYEAGVLNFIGDNLPAQNFTNKKIFITGARYVGPTGLGTFGNISVNGDTITSLGNVTLVPAPGYFVNVSGAVISNVGYSTHPDAAATTQYVVDTIADLHSNIIYQDNSIVRLSDPTGNSASFTVTLDDQLISTMTSNTASFANITINGSTLSSNNSIVLQPGLSNIVTVDATTAFRVPNGTTGERPVTGLPGSLRFNTTTGQLEWFNGSGWINAQAQLTNQIIIGDDVTDEFTLIQSTSVNNIFVMINGVVSIPVDAYDVIGTTITFAEPPKSTDKIDIRFLSEAVSSVDEISDRVIVNPIGISVGTLTTEIDSFNIAMYCASRYVAITDTNDGHIQSCELTVLHNGTNAVISRTNNVSTGGSVALVFSVTINAGDCILSVICSTAGNFLKLQRFYTTQ